MFTVTSVLGYEPFALDGEASESIVQYEYALFEEGLEALQVCACTGPVNRVFLHQATEVPNSGTCYRRLRIYGLTCAMIFNGRVCGRTRGTETVVVAARNHTFVLVPNPQFPGQRVCTFCHWLA